MREIKMMSLGSSVLLEKQLTAVCGRVVCVWCSLPHTRAPHTTKQQAAHAEALQTKRKGNNDLKCEKNLLSEAPARQFLL